MPVRNIWVIGLRSAVTAVACNYIPYSLYKVREGGGLDVHDALQGRLGRVAQGPRLRDIAMLQQSHSEKREVLISANLERE